jgi:ABC-type bacteriocin/lantibiotic exporter with double-glycine peptidase domain
VSAGGPWQIFSEAPTPNTVRQINDSACGAACGQMLLAEHRISVPQQIIAESCGIPTDVVALSAALNQLEGMASDYWQGGYIEIPDFTRSQVLDVLTSLGPWIAVLWPAGANIGHMLIVDSLNQADEIMIRDPWQGTAYRMSRTEFLNYWNGQAVYRGR